MDFLDNASKKLKNEQAKRKADAEKRRLAQAEARRKAAEATVRQEENAQRRRLEAQAAAAAEALRLQTALEEGGGVDFDEKLQVVEEPHDRPGDKIRLPPSALQRLTDSGAAMPMTFEVTGSTGRITHGGVLEFTAEEGTVALPSKVLRCLEADVEYQSPPTSPASRSKSGSHGVEDASPPSAAATPAEEGDAAMDEDYDAGAAVAAGSGGGSLSTAAAKAAARAALLPPVGSVSVRFRQIAKGTFAKLMPSKGDFMDIPQHRELLESQIRSQGHTTLTVGDSIHIDAAGVMHTLTVADLKPARAVSLLDTDLTVDIVPPESSGTSETVWLQVGQTWTSSLGARDIDFFRIKLTPAFTELVKSGQQCVSVRVTAIPPPAAAAATVTTPPPAASVAASAATAAAVTSDTNAAIDLDLYFGNDPWRRPGPCFHRKANVGVGDCALALLGTDTAFEESLEGPYWFSVYGQPPGAEESGGSVAEAGDEGKPPPACQVQYKISVQAAEPASVSGLMASSDSVTGDESWLDAGVDMCMNSTTVPEGHVKCGNCGQCVPEARFVMHEAFCLRNNILCTHPGCNAVVQKNNPDAHWHAPGTGRLVDVPFRAKHCAVFNTPLLCSCGFQANFEDMQKHSKLHCPHRTVQCRYCGSTTQAGLPCSDPVDRIAGLTQHESTCGSRTAACSVCNQLVMLKRMDAHMAAFHSGGDAVQAEAVTAAAAAAERTQAAQLAPPPASVLGALEGSGGGMETDGAVPDAMASVQQVEPPQQANSVLCPICSEAFPSERHLSRHFDEVHC